MAAGMKIQIHLPQIVLFLIISTSVSEGQLFPLNGQHLTRREDSLNHEVKLPTNVEFPFRGSRYSSLYVSKDGLVGFQPSTLYRAEDFTTTLTKDDPAFAAPFYFPGQDIQSNIGGQTYEGHVLFRYGPSSDTFNIPAAELSNYSSIILQSSVGINQFTATFGLVVTWQEVISRSDVEAGCGQTTNLCKNSTFQLGMFTDGTQSFAIFNYIDMNMPGITRYVQSGFNAGEGRGYTRALKVSEIQNAPNDFGSDVKGRYIYRIDTEQIVREGCSSNSRGELTISPKFAGMFGGNIIEISGPCMRGTTQNIRVRCRFAGQDDLVTYGYIINNMKARCHVPTMKTRGWVSVEMSTSLYNDRNYQYKTDIMIVYPERVPSAEMLSLPYRGPMAGWNETNTNRLTLTWDGKQLTDASNSQLNISLMGYRETSNGIIIENLKTLGTARALSNSFSFNTANIACVGSVCNDFEIGFVKAELQDPTKASSHRFLVSKVITLGFFVNNAMVMQLGDNWPSQKCKAWYNQDKQDMTWLQKLQNCPCNLVQALSDIGRWQTDVGCDLYDGSKCTYHIGAVHCVRSVQPSPDHAGNQCCYDKAGNLRFAADSFQGSTPDRSHAWGASPYGSRDLVPSTSHWIKDVVTFYYCCLWTGYKDCDYYMDQRPTRDCAGYTPPTPALLYGQGHIQTFDAKHQRMCADGDFILMQTTTPNPDNITVQGRFYHNVFSAIIGERGNSSVMLTNVGIKVGSQKIEIRLKLPTADRSKRHLDVLVNDKYYFFENQQMFWQDFKKFAIVNTDKTGMEGNFTVILHNGVGIQVADCNMTLCVLIMAPPSLMGKVQGLLGNFNGNATDDLLSWDGHTSDTMQLSYLQRYHMFQYKWAVNNSASSILRMAVYPIYNASICMTKQPQQHSLASCNRNRECLFDYTTTGSSEVAMQTFTMSQRIRELRGFVTPVRSCGLLDVPRSIKSNYDYKLGSKVTVQGCRSGFLQGDHLSYTCAGTSNITQVWSPSVTATCSDSIDKADIGMIVGIVIAVLAFFIILIAVGVLVRKFRRRDSGKSNSDKYGGPRSPASSGANEYTASYSRPSKPEREPDDDIDIKRSSKEYSL